jgi:hypothetical protein
MPRFPAALLLRDHRLFYDEPMRERGATPEPHLPPDTGLPTGSPEGPGDVIYTQRLITPAELSSINRAAQEILLDLHTPPVIPPSQEISIEEPPHPATGSVHPPTTS